MGQMNIETILSPEYVERYQSVWPNKTILDYLKDAIDKNPDKTAIIDKKAVIRIKSWASSWIEWH